MLWCLLKLMKLNQTEIFGLNDFLYDIRKEREQMLDIPGKKVSKATENYEDIDINEEDCSQKSAESNPYYLVCNSRRLDCYVIDRNAYIKNMLGFTTDKSLINKYLDRVVRLVFWSLFLFFTDQFILICIFNFLER